MIWKPRAGQRVYLNYKNKTMPYQGKRGKVIVCTPGHGGPVNALICLDGGVLVIVPRGQLNLCQ